MGRTLDGLVGIPPRNLLVVRIVSAEVIFVVFAGSAEGLLGDLPLLHDGIALSLDFSFALAVGGLGLLEDVDNVLALGAGSQ